MVKRVEDAVLADAYYRRLVEAVSSYAIFMLDLDGNIRSWNTGAEHIKGYNAEEIIGQHFSVFYTDEDRDAGMPMHGLQIAAQEGRYECVGWRVHKDGRRYWASAAIDAVRDADDSIIGYVKVVQDISNRRLLEERFQRVVESAPNAMVMISADGQIEMINAQTEQVFGYSREELLGKKVETLVPERFRTQHPGMRKSFFDVPISRPMGAGRDLYGLRKDGSEFPVEIGLNPIETDEGMMVLSSIVDMSLRRRLEERFRRVVESAPNAMVMITAEGQIEMVNAQAEQMFGYTREELLGRKVEMLVPERLRSHHPRMRSGFFNQPASRPMGAGRDLYALRKDGSEFPVEIGLNPIETEEGAMVLSAIVDISDRKQKEARIQSALKEKDILLGEIHHRVKNNLQIVSSLLQIQSGRINDENMQALLRESQNRVRSMALIHQTLYQSKDFGRVDFASFLDALLPTLVSSYGVAAEKISLRVDASEVSLPIDAAIPCGLIINELISNSLKHAFPGARRGEIGVELANAANNHVTLRVSDDGVGIPQGLDPEQSSTLGLQLVTLLADQLGAELKIRHADPTQFDLRFPVQR